MRGRNRNNKGPNPLTRSYESNGPDVKIRGTAQHIAEKYSQLARDAQAGGDPVAAENYFQHAEHYFRIIAAAQEQLREQYGYQQRPFDEDGEDEGFAPAERPAFERTTFASGEDADLGSQPQPYESRSDERPSRFDRGERPERGERQDRRERFQRERGPRQDFQRDDQQSFERAERPERSERPERGERQERGNRGDFRRERRRSEPETADTGGLPAFLTNPVRAPVAVESEEKVAAPAPQEAANDEAEARPRRRTRRTRRDIVEEAGNEGTFPADVEKSAAE